MIKSLLIEAGHALTIVSLVEKLNCSRSSVVAGLKYLSKLGQIEIANFPMNQRAVCLLGQSWGNVEQEIEEINARTRNNLSKGKMVTPKNQKTPIKRTRTPRGTIKVTFGHGYKVAHDAQKQKPAIGYSSSLSDIFE